MSSALEAFRLQREAVEDIHGRLREVADLLERVRAQAAAITQDQVLRQVLRVEERWLETARRAIAEVRALRENELQRFWPATLRRWAIATALSLGSMAALDAGYAWTVQPYAAEVAQLRRHVEALDSVARRVLTMTPGERRQFDVLMKPNERERR